jgi:tetratricopeptide (TPR) repeat protein
MSVEHDVSEILAHFEEKRLDKWGEQARRVADGIRQSGLIEQVDSSMMSLAAVVGVSSSVIASQISQSNVFLDEIASSVKNPLATAAAERFHSWWEDAISEFTFSVDPINGNPYFALAHAFLGQAYLGSKDPERALASLEKAIHYSTPDEPQLTTGCALLGSKILEELQRTDEAAALVTSVAQAQTNCPETTLVAARLSKDRAAVKHALWLAPELALAAVATETPGAVEAAEDLALESDGPVHDAARVLRALESLRTETYPDSGVPRVNAAENLETATTPEALYISGIVLSDILNLTQEVADVIERAAREDQRRAEGKLRLNEDYKRSSEDLWHAKHDHAVSRVGGTVLTILNISFWVLIVASFFWGPIAAFLIGGFGSVFNGIFTGMLIHSHMTTVKVDVLASEQRHNAAWSALQKAPQPQGDPNMRVQALSEMSAITQRRTSRLRPWTAAGAGDLQ